MNKQSFIIVLLLFLVGCRNNSTPNVATKIEKKRYEYKMVTPPPMLKDLRAKREYMAINFWNNIDFADTLLISHPEVCEQAMANYVTLLSALDSLTAFESLEIFITKSGVDSAMYNHMSDVATRYMNDPDSPLRSEKVYENYLLALSKSEVVDSTLKELYSYQLSQIDKNRVGEKAANFTYVTMDGKQGELEGLKSPYIILFFNNPGCLACIDIKKRLGFDEKLNSAISKGKISVLGVYTEGNREEWIADKVSFPENWINGMDTDCIIDKNGLYHLPAIPSIYLLDINKKVLLKDCTVEQLQDFFAKKLY